MQDNENNAYWRAVHALGLEQSMKGSNYALQGELVGPKIQGNWYNLNDYAIFIFDVYDIVNRRYLDFMKYREYCEGLNLHMVPVQYRTKLPSFNPPPGQPLPASPFESLEQVLSDAEGRSELYELAEREGLVWRPLVEMTERKMGRVAFKAISNKFLLAR
jgi:RNA ligase (TIGR02306 family)